MVARVSRRCSLLRAFSPVDTDHGGLVTWQTMHDPATVELSAAESASPKTGCCDGTSPPHNRSRGECCV